MLAYEGEGGLDVDEKLRLITINHFNRQLNAIKRNNPWTALLFIEKIPRRDVTNYNGRGPRTGY